jgi:SAM-dependent methyltransferase
LTYSASGNFICNVCGAACQRPARPAGREETGCATCGSTVRVRGLVALLAREIFGAHIALPDFPPLRSIRGFGMSDAPALAERLAAKFDYTNTFYHQPPVLDITAPPENELGRNDFIISSEVLEHVPPPIERAFANLYRLLKPDGLLVLTVPYSLDPATKEHYPDLHEYALASPGGRTVLVNRRRDGTLEVFENLCFHGGGGSTLEMRVFTESALREMLRAAGFTEVCIAAEAVPEFGVEHAESWSLPIVARKGRFQPPAGEIARAYGAAVQKAAALERELQTQHSEYERFIAFHNESQREAERQLAERLEWVRKAEREFEERTRWAQSLEAEKNEAIENFQRARAEAAELAANVQALQAQLGEARAALEQVRARLWARLGRRLGALP